VFLSSGDKAQQGGDHLDSNLLKYHMKKNGDTQKTLAEELGISLSCFNAKVNNNGSEFTRSEITTIARRYHLTDDELIEIFFAD
jgi:hypothetical protein